MIQRIQSLWLLLSAGLMGALFVVPYIRTGNTYTELPIHLVAVKVLSILSIVVTFMSIFMFKNRKTQRTIVRLGLVLKVLVVTYIACSVLILLKGVIAFDWGVALPIAAMILDFLAMKAIKKDDDLVKSIDRIR